MTAAVLRRIPLARVRLAGLAVGVLGALACVLGLVTDHEQFFRSWLFAHQFWLCFAAGALALLMVHHLMGGQWGIPTQRILEAASLTLPLLAVLLIPLFFGLHAVYEWTHEEALAHHEALRQKAAYLNVPFFIVRSVVYFAVWIVLAWLLRSWAARRDREPGAPVQRRLVRLSAGGLILYFLTMTFAAIDWLMSLDPEWYSAIFGPVVMMGQGLQATALTVVVLWLLSRRPAIRALLTDKVLIDVGNVMMAFVLLWTYMSFMQYLIIWMGDLSEDIPWVLERTRGGWQAVAIGLLACQFFLPLFLLLFRGIKRRLPWLAGVAGFVLLLRLPSVDWLISPTFHPLGLPWQHLATLAAIGGFWVALFALLLGRAPLVPRFDPRAHFSQRLEEARAHE